MCVVGRLALAYQHDINDETKASWLSELTTMKTVLGAYSGRGSIYLEYNIPRMGRRADVIVLIDGIVFVLEFKTEQQKFSREAEIQVWDYALDLKNFQEGSRCRTILPILVVPNEKDSYCRTTLRHYEDQVYEPVWVNGKKLGEVLSAMCSQSHLARFSTSEDEAWARSGYEPTPTIVQAAIALFEEHTVEDITRHDGDIDKTALYLEQIIRECRAERRKAVCFITGVPGAGKTLIGLQTAIGQFKQQDKAVYLSGNFPLVEVLQEALARDYIRRAKEDYVAGRTQEKPCTKAEAKSKVKAFIQMIHHYRDTYLEGTEIRNGEICPQEGYFRSHTDKAYIPTEHIAIFDEAQRAWTKEELQRFMHDKKGIAHFPYSEPEYLLSCMNRQTDWGLVICLIGGGQEINKGEAGLGEWIEALNHRFRDWHVYISDRLQEKEYADGKALATIRLDPTHIHTASALHLSASMRSFRSEKVSLFVHQLLELNKEEARATLQELSQYPIVLTRSLSEAKKWLKAHARGSERYGLLGCSKAERLKAIGVNVRYKPDFRHWFLEDDTDIRSSNALEDTLTEFEVQGLEIDWACVLWDADLRLDKNHSHWGHYQLRSGTKWQNILKPVNQLYQINAYRVLLTRARQGMVIVVPNGDDSVPPDETRKPEYYDAVFAYLRELGIPTIKDDNGKDELSNESMRI